MTLLSDAAANASLDFSYGASKAAGAPASHELALFVGDPSLGGTELDASGGYARVTVTNNGTNWPAAANRAKTSAAQAFPTSTGAWSGVATHWALISGADTWDTGELDVEIDVTAAGVTPSVAVTVFYADAGL